MKLDREEDQSTAMQILTPILGRIHAILDASVSFYFGDGYSPAVRAEHSDRTTANCIYSHAETAMKRAALEIEGLHVLDVRGLTVLNYRDQGLVRFKKVRPNGRHSNYQTKQQLDYDAQRTLTGLPDPAVRLTAGYELDAIGSGLKRIVIARPLGKNVFWTAQVNKEESDVSWVDITPRRFGGMEASDFDAERASGGRR